jgi:hypothetical protein
MASVGTNMAVTRTASVTAAALLIVIRRRGASGKRGG